jgi:hypothetical protein
VADRIDAGGALSNAMPIQLESSLTCPHCQGVTKAVMPTDACQYFYDCPHCGALLRPKPGQCCVFCSYGDTPCPPMQSGGACCGPDEG